MINSFLEPWIRADVNFPLPCVTKNFFLSHLSHVSHPFLTHKHQWFWTELRKLGKRFHHPPQANFPAAWVVEVSCFKTLVGHSGFLDVFDFITVDVQTINLRWQKEELDMLDLSGQFHGRSFVNFKESQFPFHDFQIHFPVYLNSGALWTIWTIPFPFTIESIQTEPLIIHKYDYILFSCVRHFHTLFTRYACENHFVHDSHPTKTSQRRTPATSCCSRLFVGLSFLEVLDLSQVWAAVIFSWK